MLRAVLRAGTPLHPFTGGDPTATSTSTGVLRGAASVAGPAALDTREEPARLDPDFANAYEMTFEENMVICVESLIGEVGGKECVKLETQVVITGDGIERQDTFPWEDM